MKKYLSITVFSLYIMMIACSEQGLVGPEGPAGPQGTTGAVGAAGKDGSIMYSGTGVPAIATGNSGDYYLDRATGNLYGPKVAAGWGTPLTLMGVNGTNGTNGINGTNGTNGTNGSTTLSGSGAPGTSLGIIGDYYLDKTNFLLYGPKIAAGWGIPILLQGAAGAQGPTGAAGKDGSIIYSGAGVPAATIGVNGDYYLDKNTGNLYGPKTGAGWGVALVLKGTNGTNGSNGTNGTNGVDGVNGINGSTTLAGNGAPLPGLGAVGDYYLDKSSYQLYGPKVVNGWGIPVLLRGANGAQGPAGPAGADGTIIYSGLGAPDPTIGKIGDFYMDRPAVMMYGPKSIDGWGFGVSLKGADGTNGTNGSNGHSLLSGVGLPANTTGNDGDFYLDLSSYVMYGPKVTGAWSPYGISLRGQNGADGNSNVIALETPDNHTFSWVSQPATSDYYLRKNGVSVNDTTTTFTIPAANLNAVKQGIVLVYMRRDLGSGNYNWQQLNYTDVQLFNISYRYTLRVNTTNATIRILHNNPGSTYMPFLVDKIRIVIVPQSTVGVLSVANPDRLREPMLQTMEKFNLQENDFKPLK
uniref:hypothetical protein n=1 Tax=Pedobacter schmidteae TaxID=2201271 RepID=UPI0013CEFFB1|nr:hypothetical protein [Pedobacter schmidteae]